MDQSRISTLKNQEILLRRASILPRLAALVLSGLARGEEPPLITDRPDQTESAYTVPRGLFQIEGGFSYGRGTEDGSDRVFQAFPEALLRFGVTDRFELRLGLPGLEVIETDATTGQSRERGVVDATAGFKTVIADERGAVPQTAFLGTLFFPTGDDGFSSERVDPAFRFLFSNVLNESVSIGYNVGMLWLTEPDADNDLDAGSFFDWTVSAGFSATERLGAFVELFGLTRVGGNAGARPINAVDAGVTYLLTPRLQLDASAAIGLSSTAPDWSAGIGASYRFPRFKR